TVFESSRSTPPAGSGARARPVRRTTTTKWGDREQRRADILDAARAHIASAGYLSLNMRDLAANAGVSPGTLYSSFPTKEALSPPHSPKRCRASGGRRGARSAPAKGHAPVLAA